MSHHKISLARLREADETLALDDTPNLYELDDEDWHFEGRVTGELTFHLKGDDVFAAGALKVRAKGRCGRCLEDVPVEVAVRFDYVYQPKAQEPSADIAVEHVREGDSETAYYEGEAIEPEDQIRESILLALPVIPQRDENEKCLHCGKDLRGPVHHEDWPEEPAEAEPEWKRKLRGLGSE